MTRIIGKTKQGADIAAWVMKCNPAVSNVAASVVEEGAVGDWSVNETYRLDLMQPGDRCVLWVTGAKGAPVPAGIYAVGELREAPDGGVLRLDRYHENVKPNDQQAPDAVRTFAVCHMEWLEHPITKEELLERHPEFAGAEVIRAAQGRGPAILTPSEVEMIESFDLTTGAVTPDQLEAFAAISGNDDDGGGDIHLYVNHPDGTSSAAIEDEEGELVVLRGDLHSGVDIDRFGPFESLVDAFSYIRDALLAELDQIAISAEDEVSPPIAAYEVEGGVASLHRLGENDWVEFCVDDDGEDLDEPVAYESLAQYFEMLLDELAEDEE